MDGPAAVDRQPGPDRCPRCGGGLRCGAADNMPCACSKLQLPVDLQVRLRAQFSGCLCLDCLSALAADEAASSMAAGSDNIGLAG